MQDHERDQPYMRVIDVFPRRPLRIRVHKPRPRWRRLALMLAGTALLIWQFIDLIPELADDYRLRGSGVMAEQSSASDSCSGVSRNGWAFFCSFDVSYRSADRITHTKHLRYEGLWSGVPKNLKFSVRYDPASPTHVSTSWGEELLLDRTAAIVVIAILIALAIVVFPVTLWLKWVGLSRKVAAIATRPIPVVATFSRIPDPWNSMLADRTVEFYWTDPQTGQLFFDETQSSETFQPFWLDVARTKMLALAGGAGQAHLLDAALATVDLTDLERSIVLEAKRQRDGT